MVEALAEVGFSGRQSPRTTGVWGSTRSPTRLVIEELGRADSSVRGVVSVNVGLVGKTILKWGTEEQKKEWLPTALFR